MDLEELPGGFYTNSSEDAPAGTTRLRDRDLGVTAPRLTSWSAEENIKPFRPNKSYYEHDLIDPQKESGKLGERRFAPVAA